MPLALPSLRDVQADSELKPTVLQGSSTPVLPCPFSDLSSPAPSFRTWHWLFLEPTQTCSASRCLHALSLLSRKFFLKLAVPPRFLPPFFRSWSTIAFSERPSRLPDLKPQPWYQPLPQTHCPTSSLLYFSWWSCHHWGWFGIYLLTDGLLH